MTPAIVFKNENCSLFWIFFFWLDFIFLWWGLSHYCKTVQDFPHVEKCALNFVIAPPQVDEHTLKLGCTKKWGFMSEKKSLRRSGTEGEVALPEVKMSQFLVLQNFSLLHLHFLANYRLVFAISPFRAPFLISGVCGFKASWNVVEVKMSQFMAIMTACLLY